MPDLPCPASVVKKLEKQGTADPISPATATLWIRRRWLGERMGRCREVWDAVVKQSAGSVPEVLCSSFITALRAALLAKHTADCM